MIFLGGGFLFGLLWVVGVCFVLFEVCFVLVVWVCFVLGVQEIGRTKKGWKMIEYDEFKAFTERKCS